MYQECYPNLYHISNMCVDMTSLCLYSSDKPSLYIATPCIFLFHHKWCPFGNKLNVRSHLSVRKNALLDGSYSMWLEEWLSKYSVSQKKHKLSVDRNGFFIYKFCSTFLAHTVFSCTKWVLTEGIEIFLFPASRYKTF